MMRGTAVWKRARPPGELVLRSSWPSSDRKLAEQECAGLDFNPERRQVYRVVNSSSVPQVEATSPWIFLVTAPVGLRRCLTRSGVVLRGKCPAGH